MRHRYLAAVFILLILLLPVTIIGQGFSIGFVLPNKTNSVSFPFSMINHLIVIPITFNDHMTLKFILDTGASSPILTERVFGDLMGLTYDRKITVSGPGIVDSVEAYVANRVKMELPNGVIGLHMSLLVLENDYIELKQNLGSDVYGIIGFDVFTQFVVEINYEKLEITLHNPETFKINRGYKTIPFTLEGTKPYITGIVTQNNNREFLKLMVDTGASHSLLIDHNQTEHITLSDFTLKTILGHGLGGAISGQLGRLDGLQLDNYVLNDILVSFPDDGMYSSAIKRGSRHGTIGGSSLSRFSVVMDYKNEHMYLRKNGSYDDPFDYDMSGLKIAFFDNPNRLEIIHVLPDSPAAKAGMKTGQIIHSVNGVQALTVKLSGAIELLRKKEGKRIKIKIRENNKSMVTYRFKLNRLI